MRSSFPQSTQRAAEDAESILESQDKRDSVNYAATTTLQNTKKRARNSGSEGKSAKHKLNSGLEAEAPTSAESASALGPLHSTAHDTRTTRDSIDAAPPPERSTDGGARYMIGGNALIMGGQFTMANSPCIPNVKRPGYKLLLKNVAPSAFHNSAQRADPPRCHPKTRIEILEKIHDWILQSAYRESWLLWLNGAAGAGKSAIMQTMAERCILEALAIASFFFARTDSGRNTMEHLIGSLAYQLMRAIPNTQDDILRTIEEDPLIFAQSFQSQLQRLIVDPLDNLPCRLQQPFAVFIDGLDECLDRMHQSNLIQVLGDISCSRTVPLPVIFLVSSRREPQIKLGFNTIEVSQLLENIPLDDSEASDDIRRLLNINFADIKKTHPFRHLLASDWPSVSTVSEIVEKASNQFIYASVVINYISSPRANPARRLEIVNDPILQILSSEHPFAYLDLLYRHIFSQVEDYELVSEILTYLVFGFHPNVTEIETIFSLTPGDLEVLLFDLSPVLKFQLTPDHCTEVCFLHASLPDFLQDPVRSAEYFLEPHKLCPKLLCRILERFHMGLNRYQAIASLLQVQMPSSKLQRAFMNFDSTIYNSISDYSHEHTLAQVHILQWLKNADFGDHDQAYQHVLKMFSEAYAKFWVSFSMHDKEKLRGFPDLWAQIRKLHPGIALELSRSKYGGPSGMTVQTSFYPPIRGNFRTTFGQS